MSDPASGQRGGARAGAGRRRVLTFMQRIELGAYCEDLWTRERRGDLSERLYRPAPHDEDEAAEGDDGEPILALKLPDKFRKAIKKVPVGLSEDEAQAARDAVAKQVFGHRKRTYSVRVARPHGRGFKQRVIDQAIAYAHEKWGITIGKSMVLTSWKRSRALVGEHKAALASKGTPV